MTAPVDVKIDRYYFSPKNRKGGLYETVPSNKSRTNQDKKCWTANRDQKGRRIGIQRIGEKNGKNEEASDSYQESGK